jgi:heterodisulfide reductase subunit B
MDRLLEALGAKAVDFPHKVRCCGGMLMTTFEEVALHLNNELLNCAEAQQADVIATACPLCQMNLEGYQPHINERFGTRHHLPVVYFTQLVGLALGLSPAALGMDTLLVELTNAKLKPKNQMKVAV